jgi:hypothetical protein
VLLFIQLLVKCRQIGSLAGPSCQLPTMVLVDGRTDGQKVWIDRWWASGLRWTTLCKFLSILWQAWSLDSRILNVSLDSRCVSWPSGDYFYLNTLLDDSALFSVTSAMEVHQPPWKMAESSFCGDFSGWSTTSDSSLSPSALFQPDGKSDRMVSPRMATIVRASWHDESQYIVNSPYCCLQFKVDHGKKP